MTTTPEQLAQWRIKFESRYDISQLGKVYDRYLNQDVREAWGNYVEAREDTLQETEQMMKLAKFGAMVLKHDHQEYFCDEEVGNFANNAGLTVRTTSNGIRSSSYGPNIEATIEQLSKE